MGAQSLVSCARIVTTLATMNHKRAEDMGIGEVYSEYFRMDGAKGNLAKRDETQWFRMLEVDLGQGDQIGVPEHLGNTATLQSHAGDLVDAGLVDTTERRLLAELPDGEYLFKDVVEMLTGKEGWIIKGSGGKQAEKIKIMVGDGYSMGGSAVDISRCTGPRQRYIVKVRVRRNVLK